MYSIDGKLIAHETNKPLEGLVIGLYRPGTLKGANRVASAVSGDNGQFAIQLALDKKYAAASEDPWHLAVHSPAVSGKGGTEGEVLYSQECPDPYSSGNQNFVIRIPATELSVAESGMQAMKLSLLSEQAQVVPKISRKNLLARHVEWINKGRQFALDKMMIQRPVFDRLFVSPSGDVRELNDKRVASGMERLGKVDGQVSGVSVGIDPERLAKLDDRFEFDAQGSLINLPDSIDPGRLSDYLRNQGLVGGATRFRDPRRDCKAKSLLHQKTFSLTDAGSGAGARHTPENTANSGNATPQEELRHQILAALGSEPFNLGNRPDAQAVTRNLNTSLSGGPADETAYHDFHSLQIAFENTWTSMVDSGLADEMAELYQEAVQVAEDYGLDRPRDLSELNDLQDLVSEVRGKARSWKPLAVLFGGNEDDQDRGPKLGRLNRLIAGIDKRLKEGYRFDVFKPHTYNFGLMTTYRQKWEPQAYQAGDLVATIPLAPGEKRSYKKRRNIQQSRAEKEVRKAMSSQTRESEHKRRADAEIVERASFATNFDMTTSGSLKLKIPQVGEGGLSQSIQFSGQQSRESASTKRDFREAVRRAATEYRNERTIEISSEESTESLMEETGELSNPNSELTVTYLFYELQRQYWVSEQLHGVQPVIMVAMDMPRPHEIDEDWLLAHEWVLRRVLLDKDLVPALDYLTETFSGDELGVSVLQAQWEEEMSALRELKGDLASASDARRNARDILTWYKTAPQGSEGLIEKGLEALFGGENEDATYAARTESAVRTLEWLESDLAEMQGQLSGSLASVQETTRRYVSALRERQNRRTAIDQLRMHIKQNILYYMQAIWVHMPPDQRFFELYDLPIREPEASGPCTVRRRGKRLVGLGENGEPIEREELEIKCPLPRMGEERPLYEVADVDNLLGFKGNYAIFPMRESNALTTYMMQGYLDDEQGVRDPDHVGELFDPFDIASLAECRLRNASLDIPRPVLSPGMRKALEEAMANLDRKGQLVIVPSGELFIEALPGTHPLLEDFKLKHRALDTLQAEEELRERRLENLRRADRLLAGERGDPEIDKQVVVHGDAEVEV
ncbi:hypothetical protein [Microbulbifer sediminum]|uniref:hypothetical protein n=1 Tax=Microbulbifer sediminum TaxID=2904250 RepID=UPI001F180A5B|nr:hypothetical protein [Microbulbifer sediminum]